MAKGSDNIVDFPSPEQLELEAAHYASLTTCGDMTPEDEEKLESWLAASERHQEAYARMAALWSESAVLRELSDIADSVEPLREAAERRRVGRVSRGFIAASVVAVLLIGIWSIVPTAQPPRSVQDYVTDVGEQRNVELPDGTRININTGTALSVDFSEDELRVRLLQGEAFMEVARDPSRPFVVDSTAGEVRALGTAFATRLRGRSILEVTVTEGRVAVASKSPRSRERQGIHNEPAATVEVSAGNEAVIAGDVEHVAAIDDSELTRRLSWRSGVVVFAGDPLHRVVEDISRYTDIDIRILDPDLEQLPIGGYFRVGEVEPLLESLEIVFGIKVIRDADGIALSRDG